MSGKNSRTPAESGSKSHGLILSIVIVALIAAFFLFKKGDQHEDANHDSHSTHGEHARKGVSPHLLPKVHRPGDPVGDYQYLYDKANGANRFLLSKALSKNFKPDSDAPAGQDLWIQDESGKERLLSDDVYRAKFSPDGTKIAYTTSDCVMHIEDLNGNKVGEIQRAYEPNWSPDGGAVVYAAVPDGRPVHIPEVLGLSVYDVATGQTRSLTDGQWDDVRPNFDPSGEWVYFVSGARSGLASFWRVSANGGPPEQVTNLGMEQVNELFVPTPYDRTIWSKDKRWFVYDYKNGDQQEIWAMEFDAKGKAKPHKIGEGLDPRWAVDGRTIVSVRDNGGRMETVEYKLP